MRAGSLRHRVIFDEPVITQAASGAPLTGWTTRGAGSLELSATVLPLRGREQFLGGQILAVADTRITVRWSPDADRITARWRAHFAGITYDIKSVVHVETAHRVIELLCQSGVTNG